MTFSSFLRFLVVLGIVILEPIFCSSISWAQIITNEVINKLDANYYYPHKKGLLNISAQVKWEQQDVTTEKNTVFKKLDFRFYGEFKGGIFRKGFVINESGVILSDDEKKQYTKRLNSYLDAFIPMTLHEKFSKYQGRAKVAGKEKILLRFENLDSSDTVKHYELLVDTFKWRLAGLRIRQKHEPRNAEVKLFYSSKEGQWVVKETLSSFTVDDQKYLEKTEYMYKKTQSYWLVNRIRQRVQQDGHDIFLHTFRFVDYKINSAAFDY